MTAQQWFAGLTAASLTLMNESIDYSVDIDPLSLTEIGQGGEGRVYAFQDNPSLVYKEYHPTAGSPPSSLALKRIIDLPNLCAPDEQAWILDHTVWPLKAVIDGNRLRGYTMRKIPDAFHRKYGARNNPRQILCDWNYLSMRTRFLNNPNIISEVPIPSAENILELIRDLAKTLEILHRHDIIIGDLSGRNLLWTDTPTWRVLLIDCDSFRLRGVSAVNSSKQSPDWEDPELQGGFTTQSSDIYKLGLAAFRAIWAASTDRPTSPLPSSPTKIPNQFEDLTIRSTIGSSRPSASEWVRLIRADETSEDSQETIGEADIQIGSLPSSNNERLRPKITMNGPNKDT
jgi:serine/threonine protein kinase